MIHEEVFQMSTQYGPVISIYLGKWTSESFRFLFVRI